ncbi:hypothetical protein like AT5G13825 [Hibiscus trionum]|uniref:MBD domain-containing protein n=1 Tax=Hibiscus trionum TaxID=183268 RepID=A0A9W7JK81_HIBTR|nr:hypothetical protein like AT5G13825 [Hibiscus trionum]
MKHEKVELISPESSSSKLKAPPQKWSPATLATLKAVKERTRKRDNKRTPNVVVKYYDNTYTSYDWLVSGWIVEERFVPTGRKGTGRTYKYYYDPTGRMYYTKRDVLFAWKISKLMKSKVKIP